MQYRKFGRTGWQVSEIGYGMWGMGGWTGSDDDASLAALSRAVELGCNFFDTANAYGAGRSENLLGRLVRDFPDKKLYTATKVPPKNMRWPAETEYTLDESYPPDHIEEYLHKSLENSGLERFDLLQLHTWNDDWTDDDRWANALDSLKRQDLIGGCGISINRWEPWNGIRAVRSGRIDSVQVIYNIFDQNPEDELFPACIEHDVAVIARVPFDEGTLTGTLTKDTKFPESDWRSNYFNPENLNASVDRAEALRPLIPADMTMPEMALRHILSQPAVSTIIPGMRQIKNVEANCGASDKGPLSPDLLETLKAHRWVRKPTPWSA
ncbi:MAG: aldo/keto reductase [Acidobacteria bacterium]|nr:aldo/keto reductase [Acidobacteriota bacterium]MBK8810557.1 aldo/keto reductase [Acidobacteriota bacterium]